MRSFLADRLIEATIDPFGGYGGTAGPTTFVRVHGSYAANGTGYLGSDIVLDIPRMIQVFGEPDPGDQYKISMEWIFTDTQTGDVFTLYDWKLTTLYDQQHCQYHPKDLRLIPVKMNIGGKINKQRGTPSPQHIGVEQKFVDFLRAVGVAQ